MSCIFTLLGVPAQCASSKMLTEHSLDRNSMRICEPLDGMKLLKSYMLLTHVALPDNWRTGPGLSKSDGLHEALYFGIMLKVGGGLHKLSTQLIRDARELAVQGCLEHGWKCQHFL